MQDNWDKTKRWFYLFAILFSLGAAWLLCMILTAGSDIEAGHLEKVSPLVISEKPVFRKKKNRRTVRWIEFKCKDYARPFEIGSFDYDCINDSVILNHFKMGDTVAIALLKADLLAIHETSGVNRIHSLIHNGRDYLDLDCRNKAEMDQNKTLLYFCVVMSVILFLSAFLGPVSKFFELPFDPIPVLLLIIVIVMLILHV